MQRRVCRGVVVIGLFLLAGCGSGASMGRVTGKVTWKGNAVKEAAITFAPVPRHQGDKEPGKPATGFTDDNGVYTLSTFRAADGALVGKHTVSIHVDDTNPARCKRDTTTTFEVKSGSNEFDIELQ